MVVTEILDGNLAAFERLRPTISDLTLADAQQLIVDTIERMERATCGNVATADAMLRIARGVVGPDRPISLLEVASGNGWLLQNLWERAAHHRIAIELTGSDLNIALTQSMQRRFAAQRIPASVRVLDACAMHEVTDGQYDIALMNFTLHHVPPQSVSAVLNELDRVSNGGMIVVDTSRNRFARAVVPILATLVAPRSGRRFARHDSIATILRSYTKTELGQLLTVAGIGDRYRVGGLPTWHPQRLVANAIVPNNHRAERHPPSRTRSTS